PIINVLNNAGMLKVSVGLLHFPYPINPLRFIREVILCAFQECLCFVLNPTVAHVHCNLRIIVSKASYFLSEASFKPFFPRRCSIHMDGSSNGATAIKRT